MAHHHPPRRESRNAAGAAAQERTPAAGSAERRHAVLRDVAGLLSQRGHHCPDISALIGIPVVFFGKVLVAGWSPVDLMWIAATVALLVLGHLAAVRDRRALLVELRAGRRREADLQAELAEANTDHLTGLPTRRFIYRYLDEAAPDAGVTVAFADADGLKDINDRLGHAAGDEHLAAIAGRLRAASLPGDMLVRLGGDEFVLATTRTPDRLAAGLTRALHAPIVIAGEPIPPRVSVGIVRTPGGDAHTALGRAEAAMRTAKRRRSFIEHYDAGRDGTPLPPGIRPAIRPRDQRPDAPATPGHDGQTRPAPAAALSRRGAPTSIRAPVPRPGRVPISARPSPPARGIDHRDPVGIRTGPSGP